MRAQAYNIRNLREGHLMQRAIIILWGCLFTPCLATGSEDGWIDLIGEGGLEGWRKPVHAWVDA